tara:strand:- start:55 stop:498 length:444 start_codon:yes stop_codon:yes gene_type:complete
MGRVFFNTRLNISKITADYQAIASDSGKCFMVKPAAATTFTLPALADVVEGWNCKMVVNDDGTGVDQGADAKINVDMGSGVNLANVGWILEVDGAAGDHCVANDDFVTLSANASPGDTLYFWTDGTRWNVEGFVKDLTEVAFAQAAA